MSQPVRFLQEVTVLQSLAEAVDLGHLVDVAQSLTVLGFVHYQEEVLVEMQHLAVRELILTEALEDLDDL
jgi:hypothetical protein